ncbi:MAG: hypothetical protein HY652_06625 [Acidobacteria bacterium]|nr:hypothetical protein [Acidobacteriota bacterium]
MRERQVATLEEAQKNFPDSVIKQATKLRWVVFLPSGRVQGEIRRYNRQFLVYQYLPSVRPMKWADVY